MRGPELSGIPDVFDIVDPRGRANRKGLIVLAVLMFGCQVIVNGGGYLSGHELQGPASWVIHSLFVWLGLAALSKRLHDLGISAWWLLWAAISLFVWTFIVSLAVVLTLGLEAVIPGSSGMMIAMSVSFAPVLALTLWMHFVIGDVGSNMFGPAPGASGFSKPYSSSSVDQQTGIASLTS